MKSLAEIWRGEKLELKIGKEVVQLGHLPAHEQMKHLKDISSSFYLLNLLAKEEERMIDLPIHERTRKPYKHELKEFIERSSTNSSLSFLLVYSSCVRKVWGLVRRFVPWYKRLLVKRSFYREAMKRSEWLIDFMFQVYNYWLYLGKQISLVVREESPQMTPSLGLRMPSLSMVMGTEKSRR